MEKHRVADLFNGPKQFLSYKQGSLKLKNKNPRDSYKFQGENSASNVRVLSLETEMCQVTCG